MRTRIKICGMTRAEDAAKAAELGVDFLGLNFFAGPRMLSIAQAQPIVDAIPGYVDNAQPVSRIVSLVAVEQAATPAFIELRRQNSGRFIYFQEYGWNEDLVRRQNVEAVETVTKLVSERGFAVRALEKIGMVPPPSLPDPNEPPSIKDEFWTWLPVPVANRSSIGGLRDLLGRLYLEPGAVILDTSSSEKHGGTGERFDWNWIADARENGELEGLPPIFLAGGLTPENVAEAIRIARPYAVDVSSGVEIAGKPGIKDPIKMRDFVQAVRGADGSEQTKVES